jgi:hypothetical protein
LTVNFTFFLSSFSGWVDKYGRKKKEKKNNFALLKNKSSRNVHELYSSSAENSRSTDMPK